MKASITWCAAALLGILILAGSGCTAPISARETTPKVAFRQLHANVLTTGELTPDTRTILRRYDQELAFEKTPDDALKVIREKALASHDRDEVFALAEMNYQVADRVRQSLKAWEKRDARDYFLSSAVYSYLYLFGESDQPKPDGFDVRFRVAVNLYNSALGLAFTERRATNSEVTLTNGTRPLPAGQLAITVSTNALPWPMERFDKMLLADQFEIQGLSVRNRNPGLGVPIIAVGKSEQNEKVLMAAPVSAFLRLDGGMKELDAGSLHGTLEMYAGYNATNVTVAGQKVPVMADTTAPMAYSMNQSLVWALGRMQFLSYQETIPSGVYLTQPYEKGKIPVVFVHGTFSSPIYWMEMANTLRADDALSKRYQFWYFIYNTGNPVPYSARLLQDALTAKMKEIDPEGKDPALRQMVVIGHSQGGLLTKLTATDTGDALLNLLLKDKPQELEPAIRDTLNTYLVFKPLPFVTRVVFICTPHRGSYLSGSFARNLARKFITLPGKLHDSVQDILKRSDKVKLPKELADSIPTSLDSMSPDNKYMLTLADIKLAPGVKGHSIIAVKDDGDYHEGTDGVVAYKSAHLDYTESEFIVHSGHSCQALPATIGEVRRILYEHLGSLPAELRTGTQTEGSK